jgi:hypothetical protein
MCSGARIPGERRSGMENIMAIATKPDNIPIIGMLVLILVCLGTAMKQAFRHDRLIKKGQKDRIFEEMYR